MTEPIRGKVARVLNAREIAINVGTANGVTSGMHFDVMEAYDDIKDPDTDEALGTIELPKVRMRITRTAERISVATTYRAEKVNIGGTGPGMPLGPIARALMPPNWVTKYETLKKTEETQEVLEEEDSLVKTGDPVVQVIELDDEASDETNRNSGV